MQTILPVVVFSLLLFGLVREYLLRKSWERFAYKMMHRVMMLQAQRNPGAPAPDWSVYDKNWDQPLPDDLKGDRHDKR